ncbi:extracellular solute-binding protein [bacterium]|nr:extracellular solute-binding protein [bacterium]
MTRTLQIIILITFLIISGIFFLFKPTKTNNEVVFWTLQMSDFAPYINSVISEFEEQNPNIKIKWVDVPFSEGEKRTLASVLSDNPPDLVNLNPDFSSTLANKKALYEISEEELKQFNPEILNSLKTDGKIYSIPWYATSAITIYNRDLIKKSNITVPKTYSDLFENAKFTRQYAYITFPNITENDTMLKILNKYGVANAQDIKSNKSVNVFNSFKHLYQNDLIPKETVTVTLQEALGKYMSGNVVLLGAGANFLNMIKENSPSTYEKTDVAPQITGELGQNDFSLMNFVIPLKAKHKEQALKFALFLTNNKNQLELAKLTNILATNAQTLQNDFYTHYNEGDLMAKARVISAKQLNKVQPVFRTQKNQKDINNLVNTGVQKILLGENTQKVLDEVSNSWEVLEKR